MMRQSLTNLLAITATLIAFIGNAMAQENVPFGPSNYEQDLQIFAPFELDLDNMTDKQWSGYFFEYNKLFWSYSGERTTVGSGQISESIVWVDGVNAPHTITATNGEFAEIIYRFNPQDFTNNPLPPPHVIHNTLTDVPPDAGFAFGNRYEVGYRDEGHGWTIGVLDGPQLNQSRTYGFTQDANGDFPPFVDPDYNAGNAQPGGRAFGFGSVPILFETPPGYLLGFRDYMNNFGDAALGTQRGIVAYVGNYGDSVDPNTLPIPFFHLADDINGNGILGAFPIIVVGPDGVARLSFIHDFDDLFKFNIFFDQVTVRSRTQTDGVELMWSHQFTNTHHMAKHQNNQVSVGWGARFLRMYDQFDVDALGSVLGDSSWSTSFTNNIVGPQVAFKWVNERQRWRIQTDARFMAGYNIANWDQIGLMGEELLPGALNRLLYGRPTAFSHGLREQEFAPVGELRVAASYHITSGFALNLGYTGTVVGGIKRAASSVKYALPEMGYEDNGTQELLINGFDLGVEFVH